MTPKKAKPMTVGDLYALLEDYGPDLPILVRMSEPIHEGEEDQIDYWALTAADIVQDYATNPKTKKEFPALLIGDDRI